MAKKDDTKRQQGKQAEEGARERDDEAARARRTSFLDKLLPPPKAPELPAADDLLPPPKALELPAADDRTGERRSRGYSLIETADALKQLQDKVDRLNQDVQQLLNEIRGEGKGLWAVVNTGQTLVREQIDALKKHLGLEAGPSPPSPEGPNAGNKPV
jgi:hypothetical protein